MNIHEHQAKQILKKYGAAVPNGIFGFSSEEIVEKAKKLQTIFDRIEFVDLRICFIIEQMEKSFLNEKIKIYG